MTAARDGADATWVVVPAAGVGARMGADRPKQYLDLCGKAVLEHTLERLLAYPFDRIVVAISRTDTWWQHLPLARDGRIQIAPGGDSRAASVLACLEHIDADTAEDGWVMVHDGVRPCVVRDDLTRVLALRERSGVGGLLAVPAADTLKHAAPGAGPPVVGGTLSRKGVWLAQTPQLFRRDALYRALLEARAAGVDITDEAGAVEMLGYRPRLIEGRRDNIKITTAADLELAEIIMARQRRAGEGRP